MTLTIKHFNKQKKYMMKRMNISSDVYEMYSCDIMKFEGVFSKDKTYCGPGKVGDWVVPDLWFSFSGYCHDALYSAINKKTLGINKQNADLYFYYSMLYIAGWTPIRRGLAYIYYKSVDKLGNPE